MEEQQEGVKNSTRVLAISFGRQLFVYEGEAGEAVAKGVGPFNERSHRSVPFLEVQPNIHINFLLKIHILFQ